HLSIRCPYRAACEPAYADRLLPHYYLADVGGRTLQPALRPCLPPNYGRYSDGIVQACTRSWISVARCAGNVSGAGNTDGTGMRLSVSASRMKQRTRSCWCWSNMSMSECPALWNVCKKA